MLLAHDGRYAYIHAGQQEFEADEMLLMIQPATKESLHYLDRCRRGVMAHDTVNIVYKRDSGNAAETAPKDKPAHKKVAGFLKKQLGEVCCCTHFPAFGLSLTSSQKLTAVAAGAGLSDPKHENNTTAEDLHVWQFVNETEPEGAWLDVDEKDTA